MPEQNYEKVMKKTDQVLGFSLYVRDWKVQEIANELDVTPGTIRNWMKTYDWRHRKMAELRNIEEEMREKVIEARSKIIDIGTQTLDDVFIRDAQGNIVGVAIQIERVADLKSITETLLKAGGVADKIDQTITKDVTGEMTVKVEQIDPELAAEIGKRLAIKESEEIGEANDDQN